MIFFLFYAKMEIRVNKKAEGNPRLKFFMVTPMGFEPMNPP